MAKEIKLCVDVDFDVFTNPDVLLKKSKKELLEIILRRNDLKIPISIFTNDAGPLECLVKYLKDDKNLDIKTISIRLNRNINTIWTTYKNVKNKKLVFDEKGLKVPLYLFSKTTNSVLESLVFYLKDSLKLRLCEISTILHRDQRTIYIHYQRYTAKTQKTAIKRQRGEARKA